MAAAKDAVVIALDVGPSMCQAPPGHASSLETSVKAINMIIQRKMFANAKDEFALILFGTEGTDNVVNARDDGYEHITVARELGPPDLDLLRFVHGEITPGMHEADFIDAIVVAMDLLQESTRGKKFAKKIYIFSDLGSPFGDDQMDVIVNGLKDMEVQLTLIGPDLHGDEDDDEDDAGEASTSPGGHRSHAQTASVMKEKTAVQIAGENCMRQILETIDGQTYSFRHVLPMLTFFQTRSIKQTTAFRGPLEIGSQLKINVYGYIRVKEEKLPTWKKLSALAQASEAKETMEVRMERSYHLTDEDDTEVDKENVAQGYRYGKSIVPLTKIDKDSMKLTTQKCLSVLQFTPKENIKRHQYLGETVVAFVAQPGDQHAAVALSAFISGLYELESVAIVRYCRAKNAAPKLGFLTPHTRQNYEVFSCFRSPVHLPVRAMIVELLHISPLRQCLLFTALPFTEDLRDFPFASLDANKKHEPTAEQVDAVDGLVTAMDLTRAYRDEDDHFVEALKPKCTFNPTRQRLFQCIQHRALNPDDSTLPELDPVIASYMEPGEEFKVQFAPQITKVKDYFRLERVEKKKVESTENIFKARAETDVNGETAAKRARTDEDETDFSMASLARGKVTQVGTIDPIGDFRTLISQKDVDMFDEAAKQMRERILQLVLDSFKDQFYPKALACVKVLREEAIKAGEVEMFNDFLQNTKTKLIHQRGHIFWVLLVKERVTLISQSESSDSTVTNSQASGFLEDVTDVQDEVTAEEEVDDVDDLLEMMD